MHPASHGGRDSAFPGGMPGNEANEQIYQWETLHRRVEAKFDSGNKLTLGRAQPLREATLLPKSRTESVPIRIGNQAAPSRPWNLYGFDFEAVPVDVAG